MPNSMPHYLHRWSVNQTLAKLTKLSVTRIVT